MIPGSLTIVQNDPQVPPGHAVRVAEDHGVRVAIVRLDAGDDLPDPSAVDAALVLGGEMGAYDDHRVPYLEPEKAWLRSLVAADVPVLGLCLGCQLLADALGGAAYLAERPEVVFGRLRREQTDPVVDHLVESPTLAMHRDTWDLPRGSRLVARTAGYPGAFRMGSALGVQPHPEVDSAIVTTWLTHREGVVLAEEAGADPARVLAEVSSAEAQIARAADGFFSAWYEEAGLIGP